MKKSEARVLMFLLQVRNIDKNAANISTKLDIGYVYLSNILRDMISKNWLFKHRIANKTFYDLTKEGKKQVELAKEVVNDNTR